MILFHNPESELSRALMATKPEGCAIVVYPDPFYSGPAPCELPTVLVDVPEYVQGGVTIPAHAEALRLPANWGVVQTFLDGVEGRGQQNIAE